MRHLNFFATFSLGTAILALSSFAVAQQAPRDEKSKTTTTTTTTETHRVYDPDTKEYHDWNAQEDRAYRMYLKEHNREYEEFPKVKTTEQSEYWKWRKGHPDSVIFKSETKEERH
jgi:hypothetical protein